jgi:DMSO reductase anchor subunit
MSWLGHPDFAGGKGLAILLHNHLIAFYLRLVLYLLAIAFGFWAFFTIRSDTTQNRLLFAPALLAWASILAAQIVDRLLFYTQNISPEGF